MNITDNQDLARDLIQKKNNYYDVLKTSFQDQLKRWRMYYGRVPPQPDTRTQPDDKDNWKSYVNVPKATANTDAVSATVTNIICSSSPLLQAIRTRDLNVELAEYAEKIYSYAERGNKLRSRIIPAWARNTEIQGMQALKTMWQDRSRKVYSVPTPAEYEFFWNQVLLIKNETGADYPDPKVDMEGFKVWCDIQRSAGKQLGQMPEPSSKFIAGYQGPWYSLPAFWNLYYNPFIPDVQEQEVVFERTVVPISYIKAMAGEGKAYDEGCVMYGLQHAKSSRYTTEEQAFYNDIGLNTEQLNNAKEATAEVIEAYMPSNPDIQFAAILNDCVIINNDFNNPNPAGDIPYVFAQRKRDSNTALGHSPYTHNEGMLKELSALESAKLTAISLASVPAFKRKGNAMASMQGIEDYIPAKIYDISTGGDLEQIEIKVQPELYKQQAEIDAIIDMGWGVGGNVRGQQASVGRVTQGEFQSRLAQATLPLIEFARELEDSLQITVPWCFAMFKKYSDEETRYKLFNKLESIDVDKINQILEMDFQFTGATQAGNRTEMAQLILMWMKQIMPAIQPPQMLQLAKTTATLFGIPDIGSILGDPNPMADALAAGAIPGMTPSLGPNPMAPPVGAPNGPVGGPALAVVPPVMGRPS